MGVGIIITDSVGRILLERRKDNGMWGLPGGAIDPGESVVDATVREAKEETNLDIQVIAMVGVYSEPDAGRIVTYPDNGDVRHLVDIVVNARVTSGELQLSDESLELQYFSYWALPENLVPCTKQPLEDFFSGKNNIIR